MPGMAFSPHVVSGSSYRIDSGLILSRGIMLPVLRMARCHLCRHHIANPAAQGQQGDHESEKQVAHG